MAQCAGYCNLLLNTYICCDDCEACSMFRDLRDSREVKAFMRTEAFKDGKLKVDATLCDHQGGFHAFTEEEFRFQANTCENHALGIGAANYTHVKYFLNQANYDKWYDRAVRMSKIGIELVRERADELMKPFMEDVIEDPQSYS